MGSDDGRGITIADLPLARLWELAEPDLIRRVGPVASTAARIGFFSGAFSVLKMLSMLYGLDGLRSRLPVPSAIDLREQWEFEIETYLPRKAVPEPKD